MNRYLEWNEALLARYFPSDSSARQVHLNVTIADINEVGRAFGGDLADFVAAAKDGPVWCTRAGLAQKALQAFEGWRGRRTNGPPYLAYLCLFTLAAGMDGDFSVSSFYPRLRKLLGYPHGSTLPSYGKLDVLWDDLEQWTSVDQGGQRGLFAAERVGGMVHTGLAFYQVILDEHERANLPAFFAAAGFDPTFVPTRDELLAGIRQHGEQTFRPRTRRLATRRSDETSLGALLQLLEDELRAWDGRTAVQSTAGSFGTGSIRICLRVDPAGRRASATFRCAVASGYPDTAVELTQFPTRSGAESFTCEEDQAPWSTPLERDGQVFDASQIDWSRGLLLRSSDPSWRLRLSAASTRLFVSGEANGLPGLVESAQPLAGSPFFLAFHHRQKTLVQDWAERACEGVRHFDVQRGLPAEWELLRVDRIVRDVPTAPLPSLRLPVSRACHIALVGGLRRSSGNNFFAFAPPRVAIEGSLDEGDGVVCDGQPMEPGTDGLFPVPKRLPTESRVVIEVKRHGSVVASTAFYLSSEFGWRGAGLQIAFDKWGNRIEREAADGPVFVGPDITGTVPTNFEFSPALLPTLKRRRGAIVFIGPRPGQVAEWTGGALPSGWRPTWAISEHRATYCGVGLPPPDLTATGNRGERRAVRDWKELLWYQRLRIEPPSHVALRQLWKQYQEGARRVETW